eukprot:266582_1
MNNNIYNDILMTFTTAENIQNDKIDMLKNLIKIEDERLRMLTNVFTNNERMMKIANIAPLLINLLEIKLAKLGQLNDMHLQSLLNIEVKISECSMNLVHRLTANVGTNFIQLTNFVLNALLQKQFSEIKWLKKSAIQKYLSAFNEEDMNLCCENIKRWLNQPKTIQQWNVQQLVYVTDYVIVNILPDLIEYKQNIIDYMQQKKNQW